ncbi:hypothetical protein [Streptomyces hygroscopicus]|uniref:hypothetical protein n=1 Tax=Streptomyces hygroscopicus TaxID=1912 RepID=UPI0013313880|nr:hypothetical protein [Streptomyces hygroscopicus]
MPTKLAAEDTRSAPVSEAHWYWQVAVRPEQREVYYGNRICDLVATGGRIVEVQVSPISAREVSRRTAHYRQFGPVAWIFIVHEPHAADRLRLIEAGGFGSALSWDRPRLGPVVALKQGCDVYLDLGHSRRHGGRHLVYKPFWLNAHGWSACWGKGALYEAEEVRESFRDQYYRLTPQAR